MIYLSAQPDAYYFYWQLELLLESLKKLNVPAHEIHVLIGYDPSIDMSSYGKYFIKENSDKASFFTYEDKRNNKIYVSSIRPHIIKQHFFQNEWLSKEKVFYHDSDILFTEKVIDFNIFSNDDCWYASDACIYLNADYIKSTVNGHDIFERMCNIVGVSKRNVEEINEQTGGAQYVLKNVDFIFWEKVELDSLKLYLFFKEYEKNNKRFLESQETTTDSNKRQIQGWCSDMWAILWNGIYFGHTIKIAPSLEFMWPVNHKVSWENASIYHDAGVVGNLAEICFDKKLYKENPPYYYYHKHVDLVTCSSKYVDSFYDFISTKKYDLLDSSFVIILDSNLTSEIRTKLFASLEFLSTHFFSHVFIVQKGFEKDVEIDKLLTYKSLTINYKLVDPNIYNTSGKVNNFVYSVINCVNIIKFNLGCFISPQQIVKSIVIIRDKANVLVTTFDIVLNISDPDIKNEFMESRDIRILNSYQYTSDEVVYASCMIWSNFVAFRLEDIIKIGGDNENIMNEDFVGFDRAVRFQTMGNEITCLDGYLYNLNVASFSKRFECQDSSFLDEVECIKSCHFSK